MKIPLNTLTVSLFDVCLITRANLPALEPEAPAIPPRHKKSWIRTRVDLSFLPDSRRFASFGPFALFAAATHILFPASPRRFVGRL